MARNPYNGFTAAERTAAGYWIKKQRAQGLRQPHTTCQACLREGGSVKGHSEDYSAPYGDHIGEHGLCYPCHMAVHARFKYPDAWARYRALIAAGHQHPDASQYQHWIGRFLSTTYTPPAVNEPRASTWLDTLPMSEEEAIARYNPAREPATLF